MTQQKDSKQKTTLFTPQTATRNWVVIDAQDQVVGRLATKVAALLRGKDSPAFTPNIDNGHFVVILNANKVRFTGNKWQKKNYYHHTGFPGGIKSITAEKQLQKHPELIIRDAVWGMLPKNTLSRHLMRKLKIFAGNEHPHTAQLAFDVGVGKLS